MKSKAEYLLPIIMVLLVASIAFTIMVIFADIPFKEEYTLEESKAITKEHVMGLQPYKELNGENLILKDSEKLECDSCYLLTYTFTVDSQTSPGEREEAEAKVTIELGEVTHTEYSELS